MGSHTTLAALALVSAASLPAQDATDQLLDGVHEIAAPGSPGGVCAFGPDAFVVVVGKGDAPVIAGASAGEGRVLLFGHNGYLGREALESRDTGRLVRNSLRWLAGKKRSPRVACPGKQDLARVLDELGMKAVDTTDLGGVDCVVLDPGGVLSRARLAELSEFVEQGGGLLCAATGWGWQQLNSNLTLARDLPGNRLLVPFGVAFSAETVGETAADGFLVEGPPPRLSHAGLAFEALRAGGLDPLERTRAEGRLLAALDCLPDHEPTLVLPLRSWLTGDSSESAPAALVQKNRTRDWRPLGERWSEWRLLGPLASSKADVTAPLPPERELEDMTLDGQGPNLSATHRGKGGKVGWTVLDVEGDGRDLDVGEVALNAALPAADGRGEPERCAAYLYRRVELDEAGVEYALQVASDDGIRLWVNGELLLDRAEPMRASDDRIDLVLLLEPGANHLLAKVVNDRGRWSFRMKPLSSPLEQDAINAAIDRGIEFLRLHQQVDGSWPGFDGYGPGLTAYVAYGLMKSGVPASDPAVRRALAFVEANEAGHTYSLSCTIQAMLAYYREGRPPAIQRQVDRLVDMQESNGSYGYPLHPDGNPRPPDLSTTLYAALALHQAHQRDFDVPDEVWSGLVEGTLRFWQGEIGRKGQVEPAGFTYRPGWKPTGSMTAAGVTVLAMAEDALGGRVDRRIAKEHRAALESGVGWMEQQLSWEGNPGEHKFHLFWIYGVERTGNLLGRDVLGGAHWYRGGARYLVEHQEVEGSWKAADPDAHSFRDTVLALLFLNRATKPTTGAGPSRGPTALVSEGTHDLRLRATGADPLDVWVTGWSERAREEFAWSGREPRVERVRYFARLTGESGAGEELELAAVEQREGVAVQRFEAQLVFPGPGSWEVVARAEALRPPEVAGGPPERAELSSGALSVHVRAPLDETVLAYPLDRARNLLRGAGATFESSGHTGGDRPELASDGRHDTRWLCLATDSSPWWRVTLPRGVRTERILFSHTWPYLEERARPRSARVLVLVNGERDYELDIDPDPLLKTALTLPEPVRIQKLEVRLLEAHAGVMGTDAIGFSEIELIGEE